MMSMLRTKFDVASDLNQTVEIKAINRSITLVVKEVGGQKCLMLKCDYITLEHEGMHSLFQNLTLRDLSLSVATYDDRSLEYDTSVNCSNQINLP